MSDRDHLVAALLADPSDALALLALADWHEGSGLPHHAALLRLAEALRRVPWPDAAEEACLTFFTQKARLYSSFSNYDAHRSAVELGVHGWPHGVGRLPGMAAAYRLAETLPGRIRAAARRHVLRCELYSCAVIGARERDAEHPAASSVARDVTVLYGAGNRLNLRALWALRGGPKGRAVNVMVRHETALTTKYLDEIDRLRGPANAHARLEAWRQRSELLAVARTYHLSLMRTFAAADPFPHGRGVYAYPPTLRRTS